MNLNLFISQLNGMISNGGKLLEAVCDLLKTHTGANVYIKSRDGRFIVTRLSFDANENDLQSLTLPILNGENIVAKLELTRKNQFSQEDELAANITLGVCTILLRHREEVFSAEKKRRVSAVRAVINNLSFSELEAATHVIKTLDGNEGLLVAGHIADKLGFTRSVITGALRKLESSGLVESRSLGMKGTYIRVLDNLLIDELAKLS